MEGGLLDGFQTRVKQRRRGRKGFIVLQRKGKVVMRFTGENYGEGILGIATEIYHVCVISFFLTMSLEFPKP